MTTLRPCTEIALTHAGTDGPRIVAEIQDPANLEAAALHPYALPKILARRLAEAGIKASGLERLSLHGLRAGFITEAYRQGARDEEIMDHTRHRDLRTMRGYVRRARLLTESPVTKLGL